MRAGLPVYSRRNARKIHGSLDIAREARMDTSIFGDFCDFRDFSILCPGSSPLLPCGSQGLKGSSQVQNGGLIALEDAWNDFLLEAFFCQVWSFSVLLGRLWVALEARWSSPESRGSLELQSGGLRALAEARRPTSRSRHFSVKFGRFLVFWRLENGRWRLEAGG